MAFVAAHRRILIVVAFAVIKELKYIISFNTITDLVSESYSIFEDRRFSSGSSKPTFNAGYCSPSSGSTNTQRAGIGNMVITLFDVEARYALEYVFGSARYRQPARQPPADAHYRERTQTADVIEGRINTIGRLRAHRGHIAAFRQTDSAAATLPAKNACKFHFSFAPDSIPKHPELRWHKNPAGRPNDA